MVDNPLFLASQEELNVFFKKEKKKVSNLFTKQTPKIQSPIK